MSIVPSNGNNIVNSLFNSNSKENYQPTVAVNNSSCRGKRHRSRSRSRRRSEHRVVVKRRVSGIRKRRRSKRRVVVKRRTGGIRKRRRSKRRVVVKRRTGGIRKRRRSRRRSSKFRRPRSRSRSRRKSYLRKRRRSRSKSCRRKGCIWRESNAVKMKQMKCCKQKLRYKFSPYALWVKKNMRVLKGKGDSSQIMRALAKSWKCLTPMDKAKFYHRAAATHKRKCK